MSDKARKSSQDEKSIQCFFRISIGGEILVKDIVIELDIQNRPKTCESFLSLCSDGGSIQSNVRGDNAKPASRGTDSPIRTSRRSPQPTYRGCEFHRVVPGLCVQVGDWERFDGTGGFSPVYGRNWKDEGGTPGGKNNTNNKHDREGIVSMANAGKPDTNGSQFFFTLKPAPHLDGKHTVFGRVVSGMESVRKMVDVERGEKDRPVSLQRIVIENCGRLSIRNAQDSLKIKEEDGDRHQSRSKKYKRKKEPKKSERKRHDRKRHRHRHRHRYRRDESSSSDSDSNDDSDRNDCEGSDSGKKIGHRERHSKKHRKRKHRRNTYEKDGSIDGDKSSDASADDNNSSSDQKCRRHQSSRDGRNRKDEKKSDVIKKRRKEKVVI